eukprot:3940242-Rhodomonas_salina.2
MDLVHSHYATDVGRWTYSHCEEGSKGLVDSHYATDFGLYSHCATDFGRIGATLADALEIVDCRHLFWGGGGCGLWAVDKRQRVALHPEIKYKKLPFQYNFYQEFGFSYLISGCTPAGVDLVRGVWCARSQTNPRYHSRSQYCTPPRTIRHLSTAHRLVPYGILVPHAASYHTSSQYCTPPITIR